MHQAGKLSQEGFADYLVEIVAGYPEAETIHLVMDNLSSHTRKAMVEQFGEKIGGPLWNRFTVHYTPKHGKVTWAREHYLSALTMNAKKRKQRKITSSISKGEKMRHSLSCAGRGVRFHCASC